MTSKNASARTKKLGVLLSLALMLVTVSCASAAGGGTIRIDPALPVTLSSPADFEVWVQPGGDPTTDPYIFLVMTESCYNNLTGDVTGDWTGDGSPDLTITGWEGPETVPGDEIPPGTTPGVGYTVASLKDHLGTTEPIYWAFEPFLNGDITQTHTSFAVTLPSTSPRMLVYVLGKTGDSGLFNNRLPPTIPGFVVPEPATIAAIATSLVALIVYTARRRKQLCTIK